MKKKKINIKSIDAFFFDFDGVLTDNKVYIDQNGNESVRCSRADGLAFKALKKINKPTFIISSEANHVVKKRAKKLGVIESLFNFAKNPFNSSTFAPSRKLNSLLVSKLMSSAFISPT